MLSPGGPARGRPTARPCGSKRRPSRSIASGRQCDVYRIGGRRRRRQGPRSRPWSTRHPAAPLASASGSTTARSCRWPRSRPWRRQPVDEELFVVGDTLTEDGRIGKVTDAQGIVAVKPVMHRRWTPVGHAHAPDARRLAADRPPRRQRRGRPPGQGHASVTLGPGSLVELVQPEAAPRLLAAR